MEAYTEIISLLQLQSLLRSLFFISPAVDCADPGTPTNGQRSLSSSTTYNSVVTYTCNVGYTLQGSNSRTCQSSGKWSGSVPQCNRELTKMEWTAYSSVEHLFSKWRSNASHISKATELIFLRNAWILLNSFDRCIMTTLSLAQLDLSARRPYFAGTKRSPPYVDATSPWMPHARQMLQQKSSLIATSSVNVAGTSPLTASATSHITCFVNLFEVIPVEHKPLQRFDIRYVRIISKVAMLTRDALLHHFREGMYHRGNRQLHTQCTLDIIQYSVKHI